MRLYLSGHEYKYAVEQMLLTLFPDERPEYPEGSPEGRRMEIRLSRTAATTSASCAFHTGKSMFRGAARTANDALTDPLTGDRICQRLIKNAMYRAALKSGVAKPPWGALTGVRPGKLMAGLVSECPDEKTALRRFIGEFDVSPERAGLCLATTRETLRAEASMQARDVCLYVGIPFCPTRCAYCSFVSQSVEKSMQLIDPFLEALEKEIAATAEQVRDLGLRPVSLYMGGGTPTTLTASQLDRLCTVLAERFDLSALREYTVEAGRPDTITEEKLRVLQRHGVDRVSVNPQTMSDRVLEIIGRRHTAADIVTALDRVRAVGGFAVNMDLIAGLPGDSVAGFRDTLEKVLTLGAENVTVHTLALKKGSRITVDQTPLPAAREVAAMLDYAQGRLRAAGYAPYYLYRQKFMSGGFENVGWQKGGTVNLYNICIMEELRSILAMGGGGSTKLIRPDGGRNIRLSAPKYPLEYIAQIDKTCADKAQIGAFYRQFLKEE
ncbi:MAG: coproporphyrinogen dehydrogenase HemZ [Oscillospiraceae bacterium]|nr:coproporphyrinogen dehydrogenase HemZ [Oscillospiraceae bacterium]